MTSKTKAGNKILGNESVRDLGVPTIGRLGERSVFFLKTCFEHGVLSSQDIKKWLKINYDLKNDLSAERVSKRIVRTLQDYKLFEKYESAFEKVAVYNVSKQGVYLLKSYGLIPEEGFYIEVDPPTVRHELMVTRVRLAWEEFAHVYNWGTSRLLECEGFDNRVKVPDLVTTVFSDLANKEVKIAIEIELTRKSNARLERIFETYRNSKYDAIFYYFLDPKLKKTYLDVSKPFLQNLFVSSLDDLVTNGGSSLFTSNSLEIPLKNILKSHLKA